MAINIFPAALIPKGCLVGAPPRVTEETLRIDRRMCSRMKCPVCKRRGLHFTPARKGDAYRVFGVCETCGHVVEN